MITKEMLLKYKVDLENESSIVEAVYEKVLTNYMEALDEVVTEVEAILSDIEEGRIEKYSNDDLEKIAIKIPMLMYRIGGDLERVGVRIDVTEAIKEQKHNDTLLRVTGTVPEKRAKAENDVKYEEIIENIYRRVYKQVERKLNYVDSLYSSIKKVMSLRITELEVFRRENAQNNIINKEGI